MSSASFNPSPNRASLLAGLRTGGVRPPQSAAPAATSFDPQQLQMPPPNLNSRGFLTAAIDGPNNSFTAQQQQQQQVFQQAMQLELLKFQALQAQQYQAEIARKQQLQAQQQQQRRPTFHPPATAGPTGQFDLRSATLNAQLRKSQAEALKNLPASQSSDQVPMTAGLHGKFGARSASMPLSTPPTPSHTSGTTVISGGTSLGSLASNNVKEPTTPSKSDSASSWRRGSNHSALNSLRERTAAANAAAASSPTVKVTPPTLNTNKERTSPPPGISSPISKRPKPLSFSLSAQKPMIPEVLIDTSEADEDADDASSASSASSANGSAKSSPTTSNELLSTNGANDMQPPLSPREEASKRLYEGLGIGRPRSRNSDAADAAPPSPRAATINVAPPQTAALFPSHAHNVNVSSFPQSPFPMAPVPNTASLSGPHYTQHRLDRSTFAPKRQPRGPPSGADELGPLNFAARSPKLPPTAGLVGSMQNLVVEAY